MHSIILIIAPYATILFLVSFPPEIIRNVRTKVYASGTITSWSVRALVYLLFGIYSMMISEYVVGIVQFVALVFTMVILIQSCVYKHAK
jgi:uncharacterized protein with PQ loop repeat